METTKDLALKYNKPVPRYTSYPTAPHFHDGITGDIYQHWLAELPTKAAISIYIHIPFCKSLCHYCGCNTRITQDPEVMHRYCQSLIHEIELTAHHIGRRLQVSHIQWGGGTPSYISPADFMAITNTIQQHFDILPNAEFAIEIDPRSLTQEMAQTLGNAGVNRASFGVQDFNADVQKAVNRIQPFKVTEQAINQLRKAGVTQINLDLMYGLPRQTEATIKDSITQAIALNPDRLALFGYAHVPWMKKHQQLLESFGIPDETERYAQFTCATKTLANAGFHPIGIDHFAKEDDPMWIAKQNGTLHRNFQGYTTDTADTLIGFGASAISCLPAGYAQNNPSTKLYEQEIAAGHQPTHKGVATSSEDKIRRHIIMTFMCYHKADLSEFGVNDTDIIARFQDAFDKMKIYRDDNVVALKNGILTLTEPNHATARLVASCFDSYFTETNNKHAQAV